MMHYFFVLGKNPTLSLAELSAVFGLGTNVGAIYELPLQNVFILKTDKNIDAQALIKKLGGTIKIGLITSEVDQRDEKRMLAEIKKLLKPTAGKFKFGISCYGRTKFNTKQIAMEIKRHLSARKVSCRWVTSREKILSSVVVAQNKLISQGVEVVLIAPEKTEEMDVRGGVLVGQTLAVQPFKELSFRDYGRPARDDRSGMLPPKLAQIMINLTRLPDTFSLARRREGGGILLDPFCGSGTILTEAMLMGCKNLIGADISQRAVVNAQKNFEWVKAKFGIKDVKCKIFHRSAVELSRFIKPHSIDAIVTEPYLGPQRGKFNIKQAIKELNRLYSQSLVEFKKVLKPNGRVVMIWPAIAQLLARGWAMADKPIFRAAHNAQCITPNLNGFKIVNPIPKQLQKRKEISLTDRNTIIYGRKGQRIWREIVVMQNS